MKKEIFRFLLHSAFFTILYVATVLTGFEQKYQHCMRILAYTVIIFNIPYSISRIMIKDYKYFKSVNNIIGFVAISIFIILEILRFVGL